MSGLLDEIKVSNRKFMERFAAADFTGMSELFAEDCKVLPPGSPMLVGRDAVAKMFQSHYEAGFKTTTMVEDEVGSAGGDVVYLRGRYIYYLADGTEGEVGKLVILWKRVNGQLYHFTDIFNSNKP